MVPTMGLTEAMVRAIAAGESYRRGQEYFRRGAVEELARRGDQITGEVQGSAYEPYKVRITLGASGITDTSCTCPYDWGGVCKHVVAVLLACVNAADPLEERPSLESLLSPLDRDQIQKLLLDLVERRPETADWIEAHVAAMLSGPAATLASPSTPVAAASAAPRPLPPPPDPAPIRRQVRGLFRSLGRSYDHDYDGIGGISDEIDSLLGPAEEWIEAGEGRHAIAILEAVTDEVVARLDEVYDEEGELGELLSEVGRLWTEALLSADLTDAERRSWAKKLKGWESETEEYVGDASFAAARLAAEYGWDYPPLVRVLQGEITNKGAWEDEAPDGADELAEARLNVLERQGRFQEYLYLAEAESQTERFVTMLVRLGRLDEAVDYGLKYLVTAQDTLALAKALHERGAVLDALRIAEHGLAASKKQEETAPAGGLSPWRDPHRTELARWLRDQAAAAGETRRAVAAARMVMGISPTLPDYQALATLAGDEWSAIREEILAGLRDRSAFHRDADIDIFLHEGLIDDAITALGEYSYYVLVEKVVDAALSTRPDWAIQASRKQAESIMDAGKAQHYDHAVTWLAKARRAYELAGRKAEWDAYLDQLLTEHARKYKLVPMLKTLR